MKVVGIVADNFKLEKFKRDLTAKGFDDFEVYKFTDTTSTIQVMVPEGQVGEITKICRMVEMYFKRGN